ncbi:MAG: methionyl-tRNA formyltransferase, partial [Clostridia bacterium]|nr:methionyl-tRNA formyltransferase [Clostridia bacterium]
MMRIVFMGTPDFAVPVLSKLIRSDYDLVAVVTQPDRPKGRGRKLCFSPVKEKALEMGLKVLQPARVKEEAFVQVLQELQPELIVVAAFGQILPAEVLNIPVYGCLNVHASLLPSYRGAASIQRAIMAGEEKTGITIMLMDQGLDTGDILTQAEVEISLDCNFGQLHEHLALVGADLLIKTIPLWIRGEISPQAQVGMKSNYAAPLKKEDEKICWTNSVQKIYNQIRGLTPYPGAYTLWQGKPLKIKESMIYDRQDQEAEPGTVL